MFVDGKVSDSGSGICDSGSEICDSGSENKIGLSHVYDVDSDSECIRHFHGLGTA